MPRLLVVHHSPTRALTTLRDAVTAGATDDAIQGVDVTVLAAAETTAEHINDGDGLLLLTPANFGYMAGMVKDMFDRTFLEIGGALADDGSGSPTVGRKPYGLCVHGRYDTEGAVRSVQSIAAALPWAQAAPVLSVLGEVTTEDEERAYELGGTLAALLMP